MDPRPLIAAVLFPVAWAVINGFGVALLLLLLRPEQVAPALPGLALLSAAGAALLAWETAPALR